MSRTMVWIEEEDFQGFGCSECGWRFKPSGSPTGTSFDQMIRNFELKLDFTRLPFWRRGSTSFGDLTGKACRNLWTRAGAMRLTS